MKKILILALPLLALTTVGCRSSLHRNDVVKETYIHQYGVPIAKSDWEKQGKNGQIVYLRKDGVTLTRSFEKGVLDGPTTISFPNSTTVQTQEVYQDGELVKRVNNYYTGSPKQEEQFDRGLLCAVTGWYEDGTPSLLESYQDGLLVTGEYRDPLNVVESRVENGEGVRFIRGNDNMIVAKDNIQNGHMIERITYFPNGDPASIVCFEDGLIHGLRRTYLPGGLPHTVEQWIHGVQEGITTTFQNGEKVSETPFVRGEKHGTEFRYLNGQTVMQEVTWRRGVQHGITKIYAGPETRTEWYHEGELVSRHTYERMNLR